MDVKIGLQNVAREVVLDVAESAAEVTSKVTAAMSSGTCVTLTDSKDRTVVLNGAMVAYVELGAEKAQKVGFGVM